ncbi:potassium channel subfamily K member 1-like isoform X2 [Pollicipes pollicipes]|uniref:potassium channel subfamily K member 1-like isoform X2 n=1 Tax=Pollicipes pollicipes TaxID=41117 RepID=UPI00188496D1|nr:potassium channel subfamily K member 1-like isoform X2 [Pollicipes pollicipes]
MVSDLVDRVAGLRLPKLEPRRGNVRLLCLVLFYLVFLVVGAAIFSAIESPVEVGIVRSTHRMKKAFLKQHPCVTESDLEDLITEVVLANNRGVSASKNISSGSNWSFGQSFFFSATVVTTIGYGHVTPLSEGGKIFCVVFALIGIPLTLVILSAFVEKLMVPSTLALQWMNSRLGHLYQPFNIRLFHLALVGLLIVCCFFLVPAAVFSRVEDGWSFLDSLYYCFISLTTVGLGDYIPGDRPGQEYRPLYKVAITGYLLVGLVMMMWFLTVFAEIPQLNFGIMFLHQSDEGTSDPEKMRLSGAGAGPKYTQQMENHVKASSRPVEETPSPEETTPVHARQK